MRKAIVSTILILFILSFLYSADSKINSAYNDTEKTFTIRAYKLTDTAVDVNVFGTVSGSLRRLGKENPAYLSSLDITGNLNKMLGSFSEDTQNADLIPSFDTNSLFSVHISGNSSPYLSINLKCTAFKQVDSEGNDVTNGSTISAYYQFGTGSADASFYDGLASGDTIYIETSTNDKTGSVAKKNLDATLSYKVYVDTKGNRVWYARRAVGVLINKDDYEKANIGNYKATVSVKVESVL